uniref:Uncharacterized protein n=1 Tax=Anguilla anguilla TaxID=7936 RepID=A0A0E9RQ82_ANGAN
MIESQTCFVLSSRKKFRKKLSVFNNLIRWLLIYLWLSFDRESYI